jgi:hypothetical protein
MKSLRILFFYCALFLTLISIQAKAAKRILFIGNSYTGVNDLPALVSTIVQFQGDSIYYDSNTPGGYTLSGHCGNPATLSKIAQGNWDYVVLQAQSQEPSFSPAQVVSNVLPYARVLDSLIHAASPCAETVFYMTWGRKNGDASNCAVYPPVCTYTGMQDRLRSSYLLMAQQNNASVAPVGAAWREVINQNPTFDLYQSDQSHPSIYGSYLTACTFYSTFFQRKVKPNNLSIVGISAADKLFLEESSNKIVFDSLQNWYLSGNIPFASFNYTQHHDIVDFINNSINATSYFWNFHNSAPNSTQQYPSLIFPTINGDTIFTTLTINNSCKSDSTFDTVFVVPTSIKKIFKQRDIRVYFESNSQELKISSSLLLKDYDLTIYSIDGRVILRVEASKSLKLNLKKGTYLAKLSDPNDGSQVSTKFTVY